MWFNVNWSRLSILLLPTFLRSDRMKAWLYLNIRQIENVHYSWRNYRASNIYKLAHNSQICYLRGALNDRFDNVLRRIRIDDGNSFRRNYIYTDAEEKPKFLGTIYIYDDADYADTGVDFIVVLPLGLSYNIYEMKALIDFYRMASKRYKITIE